MGRASPNPKLKKPRVSIPSPFLPTLLPSQLSPTFADSTAKSTIRILRPYKRIEPLLNGGSCSTWLCYGRNACLRAPALGSPSVALIPGFIVYLGRSVHLSSYFSMLMWISEVFSNCRFCDSVPCAALGNGKVNVSGKPSDSKTLAFPNPENLYEIISS